MNSKIEIRISLDFSDLADRDKVASAAIAAAEHTLATLSGERAECDAALASDDGLLKWLRDRYPWGGPSVTRASSYVSKISPYSSLWFLLRLDDWPGSYGGARRPVLMRGSLEVLHAKYAKASAHGNRCANGWLERVVERYLRFIGYTCLDADTHRRNLSALCFRVKNKNWGMGAYLATFRPVSFAGFWVNGKHANLSQEQVTYLQKLDDIRRKTTNLEALSQRDTPRSGVQPS